MKTRVYIDGYNLYYGCLKRTSYKWLDIYKLFQRYILPSSSNSSGSYNDLTIKYFTADIVGKAAMSADSRQDQQTYHRALQHSSGQQLEIIKGYYSINRSRAFKIDENLPKKPPNECEYVDVWKLEEKQTDVNIAVESLFDVLIDDDLEQVVFVTNDTDLSRVLKKIQSLNKVKVGLVIPSTDSVRMPNEKLYKYADWTRKNILETELKNSQLPRVVEGGRKAAVKPVGWYGQPKIIDEILQTLLTVINSRTGCWRWLERTPPQIDGLPELIDTPITLLDHENSANTVLQYAKKYADIIKK